MANEYPDKKDKTKTTKSKDVKKVESGGKKKVNKITELEDDKYTKDHFGELVDDSDIQARYLQEYGILPHSHTCYCVLFFLISHVYYICYFSLSMYGHQGNAGTLSRVIFC